MAELGRPTLYTPDLATEICRRMAEGESLRQICRTDGMPGESTVRMWAILDQDGFSAQYARAKEGRVDCWAEEIIEIADDGTNDWIEREAEAGRVEKVPDHEHMNRSRLRVDTRKWLMSKVAHKQYGDKLTQELTGKDGAPLFKVYDGVDVDKV